MPWEITFGCRVTGTGIRISGAGSSAIGELAPGFRRLMTERLTPERPTSVAVTRHLELIVPAGKYPVSGFPLRVAAMTSGLRSRLIGYQVRVFWCRCGCRK